MSSRKAARVYVDILEADFQAQIVKLAVYLGWKAYHTHDSRKSREGFPDLILARVARVIAAEIKTRDNTTDHDQREWLAEFALSSGVEPVLWRPDAPPNSEQWSGLIETSDDDGSYFGAIGRSLQLREIVR